VEECGCAEGVQIGRLEAPQCGEGDKLVDEGVVLIQYLVMKKSKK
jgi:hypothetical protein